MKRRKICSIISAILLLFIATGILASAAAIEGGAEYLHPQATQTVDVYFDGIMANCLPGLCVSDVEREYLRLHGGFLISYNSGIPSARVTTEYDRENAQLKVYAEEYECIVKGSVTVLWKPISVTLYSETKPLVSPEYSATFFADSAESGDFVTVKYRADFVIDEDEVNRLLNLTYDDAVRYKAEIEEKTAEYERLLEKHLLDTEKYNDYIAALALYKQYLSEKRIYDEQLAEYNAYLDEIREYEIQKAKHDAYEIAIEKYYDDYARYKEYLANLVQYEAKLEAYEKYVENIETVRAQLAVIESTKTQVTALKRTVYDAIMGDTVTTVIANKDLIANSAVGVDPAAVDRAGVATENLRVLLKGFFEAKDESTKYNYYVTNYEGFRDNFAELFRTLDYLYMNKKVRGAIVAREKLDKYLILLAQLYYVTNALSDEPVKNYAGDACFDSGYIIGKSTDYYLEAASPAKILNNEMFVTDPDVAAPLESGYPAAVEKPDIVVVEEPLMPTYVSAPTLPETVSPPTQSEPSPVEEPEFAQKPGKAPTPYIPPDAALPIVDAYTAGELTRREEIQGALTYSPEISVRKTFVDPRFVTVRYYGQKNISSAIELLYETAVETGTYADYIGAKPVKMEERLSTYLHTGWIDANGNTPDFSCISEDVVLFAAFEKIPKEYKTSWIVNGTLYDECPDEIEAPAPHGNTYYVFSEWEEAYVTDPETQEPTLDRILTALFEPRKYVVTDSGYAELSFDGMDYLVFANIDSKMDIGALLDLAAGEGGLVIYASNATLRFSYAETIALKEAGVRSLSISSVLQSSIGGYSYSVELYGEGGAVSNHKARLSFESYCAADDPTHLYLYTGDGEEKKTVKSVFSQEKKRIQFSMTSGLKYIAREEYAIKPVSLSGVTVGLDKLVAKRGDTVQVFIDKIPGISINRVYMKHSDGKETDIINGIFTMPADDVGICVDFVIDEYVISFVSEGKTIVSYSCKYGDVFAAPAPPSKAPDGKYKYNFIGWDAEILPATQSTVYNAIYKQELLPKNDSDKGLQITPSVLKILVFGLSFAGVFLFALAPSATVFAVMAVKRKKYRVRTGDAEK